MCLIVWKEGKNAQFTNNQFKNMISRNADGLGFMWRQEVDGVMRVLVEKVLGSPKDKFKLFQKHRNKEYYAMHARLRTHGLVNEENCHPYEIMNIDKGDPIDLYLMHNGVLHDAPDVNKGMSDTWHFVEYILKPIAKANLDLLWNSEEFQAWLQKKMGASKLTLMRSDTPEGGVPVLIFNHGAGKVENGCWLSNTHSTNTFGNNQYINRGNASTNAPFRDQTRLPALTHGSQATTPNLHERGSAIMGPQRMITPEIITTTDISVTDEDGGKVIDLFRFRGVNGPYSIVPDESTYQTACLLRGLPKYEIRLFVMDDPDLSADIIMAFYEKNTMDYETIMEQIKNPNTLDGIVNIIEHVAASIESIVKTRNVQ